MSKRQKRAAVLAAAFGAAALALFLTLSALNSAAAYFYTPSDLARLAAPPQGAIRLGGLVEPGSLSMAEGEASVRFSIADEFATTAVVYAGILPDLFREGQGVVVQGRLEEGGLLRATEVLAKHDENYMPREVAEALKEQGRWKEEGRAPASPR